MTPQYYATLRNDQYCIVDNETGDTFLTFAGFLVASNVRDQLNAK